MKFKKTTIPPEGRNKYGNYMSAGNITKAVINTTYYGNSSTGGNNGNKPGVDQEKNEPEDSFLLMLSKTSGSFDGRVVAATNVTETIDVIGYKNLTRCDTYVGDIQGEGGMTGVVDGITVTIENNGTPNTKIKITISSALTESNGTLRFPCNVYRKSVEDDPLGDDNDAWVSLKDDCSSLWLEYNWSMLRPATESYTMELSNEIAGINCDKDGNIYANAVRPTCKASMWYGTKQVSATYSISTPEDKNVVGLSINTSTGELTFGSNFKFDGTTLEIVITGNAEGSIHVKVMTIIKQYAGKDGTAAVTRWVVPTSNVIKFNPNTNTVTPDKVTCKVMKQEGDSAPVEDTTTTLYYGWDTTNPTSVYSTEVAVDASKSYLAFALKNSNNVVYEIETIPILKEGTNGSNGQDGTDGKDGANGESVYRLDLTNDNAGINCDADGNIYATAYRPKCTATLYYGTKKASNVKYSITKSVSTTGLTIAESTGVLTFGDDFNFDIASTTLEITVEAKINNVLYGSAIMTVSRNYAGRNGTDGKDGADGINGADGVNGQDGTPILWKGSSITHPANPQNGWAYYNTGQKKSFIYQDGAWYQMTVDGTDGQDGKDGQDGTNGLSIVWKGESATAPANPKENWCYKDTDNGKVYIYNGLAWELMVLDGSDGEDGADGQDGKDGLSVFITYHDNAITSTPANPTGNGTTGGWHTNATKAANWMSQKVASAATAGTWGAPIQICGADGQDGADGTNGSNGEDAVTYWLEFSADAFQVSSGGTVSPSTFTIQVMKQVGGNTPVDVTPTATGGTIQVKYGHNTVVPSTQYKSGQTITVDGSKNYITVQLYVGGTKIGTETLLILHDGKNGTNGEDGAQGRQGPAVRGPVDWRDQTTSRRWCNGTLTNASYPEDGQFMDIVVFDGTYYQCKTSYNGKGGTTAPSSTYWTQVDTQYKFVATDLLLAKNAKINFQTSNELYLMDEDGNVTAGAAGGDGISFWAGANEPTNGAFKVYYNGTMESTKGKFGPLEIGVDTWSDGLLKGTHTQGDGTINTLRLQPHMLSMEADDENGKLKSSVRIGPHADTDRYDMEGDIFVELADNKKTAIATNGQIDAGGYKSGTNFTPFSPLDGLVISFITDINYFTKSGGYWFWKGMPLTRRFTASAYPYVKVINGEWCLCYSSSSTTGVGTGIYGTAHTKSNNKIYIVI